MFLSGGDRDLGVAFQTHPRRQAFISSGSTEPRSALESRRAHVMDDKEFIFSIFQENIYIKKKMNSLKSHKAGKLCFAFHTGVGNRKATEAKI